MMNNGIKRFAMMILALFMAFAVCACGHEHTWVEATCITPKTCSACGATEGEALGHTWAEATCTEPKTCSVCGATEGEALGYAWKEATCTEPKTCSVCGATEGEALGHTIVVGVCQRCHQIFGKWAKSYYVDDFQQETKVWFIRNIDYIEGIFSNSATTNSKLLVLILVDENDVTFMLYEYGRSQVKNASSQYYDEYVITMKDSTGKKTSMTGTVYAGGDRLYIDDNYKAMVLQALKGSGTVSFYIVIVKKDRITTNYLFTVECSNFGELYKILHR